MVRGGSSPLGRTWKAPIIGAYCMPRAASCFRPMVALGTRPVSLLLPLRRGFEWLAQSHSEQLACLTEPRPGCDNTGDEDVEPRDTTWRCPVDVSARVDRDLAGRSTSRLCCCGLSSRQRNRFDCWTSDYPRCMARSAARIDRRLSRRLSPRDAAGQLGWTAAGVLAAGARRSRNTTRPMLAADTAALAT